MVALKQDEAYDKHPLEAPQVGEQPQHQHSFRLSDKQIIVGFLCVGTLLALAILHGQNQAPYYVQGIRWKSLRGFCRVSIIVRNARNRSINAQAFIRVFNGSRTGGNEYGTIYDLTGSAKVPIRLAGNESRTVVTDVVFSEKIGGCDSVDVKPLAGRI